MAGLRAGQHAFQTAEAKKEKGEKNKQKNRRNINKPSTKVPGVCFSEAESVVLHAWARWLKAGGRRDACNRWATAHGFSTKFL